MHRDAVICLQPSLWFMRIPQLGHPRTDRHLEHLQSFAWAVHITPWSAHLVISIGTGEAADPLPSDSAVLGFPRTKSHFHPQPPQNHSTVWTGSANQTGALRDKPMQSTEWPPYLPLQELLLCPSLLLLLLLPIQLQLLHLLTNLFMSLQKITLSGCSRQANAVFRMTSGPKEHSISKSERRSLEAVNAVFRVTSH